MAKMAKVVKLPDRNAGGWTDNMIRNLAESATYSLREMVTSKATTSVNSAIKEVLAEFTPDDGPAGMRFFDVILNDNELVKVWRAVPKGKGALMHNRRIAAMQKKQVAAAKKKKSSVFDMPESYIRTGALLVVNWGGVDNPEFRLGKVTSLVDDGPYLQVVVAMGSRAKRRKYEFTETALGIIGFFRHDRAKRISNLTRFWLGRESVFDCVDGQDWIAMEAIKHYYGNDAEVLATQKEVRDWIFENEANRKRMEEGELKPGKWHREGKTPAESERPTDDKASRSNSLPKGFATKRMTNGQVEMVHKLIDIENLSFLMDTVTYQSEVEDDFVVDFEFLGGIYHLSSQYDERMGDVWDVESVGGRSLPVDGGTMKDVLDWIDQEAL